jgi:hypothetical protein
MYKEAHCAAPGKKKKKARKSVPAVLDEGRSGVIPGLNV